VIPFQKTVNVMKNSESRLTHRRPLVVSNRLTTQAGLTLLEVIISLSIIASATIGLNSIADRFSDDTKNTVAASQTRTFGEAAKVYIKDNYAAVQAVATPTTPALIDVPTLIAAGNLTAGFLATNAFGQSMCALVLEPTANRLQAMVVAEGGTAIDDLSMGNIASVIGGSGGAVYSSDATVIRGAIGGWTIPTSTFDNRVNNVNKKCDGTAGNVRLTAGHPAMALWFENGDTSSAFLARDAVPGRPELNAMNTPLIMNSVQTADTACTSLGAIARDATGAVLSCNGGQWKTQRSAFWQDPTANKAALDAITCNAAISGQTRVVGTPGVGTGPRAYTCNGAAWTALAVDDAGNLNVAGIATIGKVALTDTVVEGAACGATNGLVSKDSTGLLLSCQSGAWKRAVKAPNAYRYMFTSSQAWTVPAGVSSAFVTMAGGGGSGAGWRVISATFTGPSGGYVFSQPVNLVAGETVSVVVGKGGIAYAPYYVGVIGYAPAGDDGLGGYPGGASQLISPSIGTLLQCAGGSGASFGGIDSYSGGKVAGNLDGATTGSASPTLSSPNRIAAGPYEMSSGPGACGPASYGIGNAGAITYGITSGSRDGGKTPFGYGSGGGITAWGCYVTATTTGTCIFPSPGRDGVVFIDVLY
jgi:type II secretory pathway pseudopilin PulG